MKKIFYGFLISLFLIQNAYSAVPVTFTNGTVADATEVNENNNYFEGKFSVTSGHNHDGSTSRAVLKGEWQGTIVDEAYGGTGNSSYASGDLLYATADTGLARLARGAYGSVLIANAATSGPGYLAPGTSGQYLQTKGTDQNPAWATVPTSNFKVGSFTRDVSLADGTQAITGVGFQPTVVIFFTNIDSTAAAAWGVSDATTDRSFIDANTAVTDTYVIATAIINLYVTGSGTSSAGDLTSFGSDGFTLTWTKTGSPTGTATINYIAFK